MDDERNIVLASLKLYLEMNYPSFDRTRQSRNPPYTLYEREQTLLFTANSGIERAASILNRGRRKILQERAVGEVNTEGRRQFTLEHQHASNSVACKDHRPPWINSR
jgi:hypothetical protein